MDCNVSVCEAHDTMTRCSSAWCAGLADYERQRGFFMGVEAKPYVPRTRRFLEETAAIAAVS